MLYSWARADEYPKSSINSRVPCLTYSTIASISEPVYPSVSDSSTMESSSVNRGNEIVSRSTPDTTNIVSSGLSISIGVADSIPLPWSQPPIELISI